YFGLGLWLPEIFTRFRHYHLANQNSTVSLRDLMRIDEVSQNNDCSPTFDSTVFQNTLAMGISSLVCHLTSGFLAGRIDRKIIPTGTMLLAGLCSAVIYFLSDSLQIVIVACAFQSSIATANMALSSITVDLFPTSVNAVGTCLVTCAGRIGAIVSNVLFGYLMSTMTAVPLFSVAIVLLITGLMCLIIPVENNN
ncbi:solute carrier family 22 member 13-like, partial [Agrilus planipennis]|uniref:Solute carrier family 22 member 13-like n=1 Tax=Agrilus planipennis TaxID=224129 RepID=A0A1W4XRH4_AGRPL